MNSELYSIQKETQFSKSLVWQLNRDFYQQKGIAAWTDEIVPHQITNSSIAATSYAELIYALLKDLESNDHAEEIVFILELGAGSGRLCFNVLQHLDKLISDDSSCSTKYCYVLSDITEENLSFLSKHPKLQRYYEQGVLDLAYFDAMDSQKFYLRKSEQTIASSDLKQPIIAIANYFFDSIPNELFYFQNQTISKCSVSIDSLVDPVGKSAQDLISQMELTIHNSEIVKPEFENEIFNEILSQYNLAGSDSYILFPKIALECLSNISSMSSAGLVLLTMDKGYKSIQELEGRVQPDFVKHGSFSLWVNFHAISQFCIKSGGLSLFDTNTNLSIDFGCLLFGKASSKYPLLEQMFRKHSDQINLDDLNSMKKLVYNNIAKVDLSELLGLIRLNSYDSSIFIKLLPRIKQLSKNISIKQRTRLKQTIGHVWNKYYAIKEDYDLSYELGGLMYDLAFYQEALDYFDRSTDTFGFKLDVDYNSILCYYQLRQDKMFYKTLKEAKLRFPLNESLLSLDKLDMN